MINSKEPERVNDEEGKSGVATSGKYKQVLQVCEKGRGWHCGVAQAKEGGWL